MYCLYCVCISSTNYLFFQMKHKHSGRQNEAGTTGLSFISSSIPGGSCEFLFRHLISIITTDTLSLFNRKRKEKLIRWFAHFFDFFFLVFLCFDTDSNDDTLEQHLENLAPKKVDWDLKRIIQKSLDKLEKRTQRSIAGLIRERIKSDLKQDTTLQEEK